MKEELQVQNLKCGGCAKTIANQLLTLGGIEQVEVEHESSMIVITYQHGKALEDAKEKLKTLGYPIAEDQNNVWTKAKSYVSCAAGKFTASKN